LNEALRYGETLIEVGIQDIYQKLANIKILLNEFTTVAFGLALIIMMFLLYAVRSSMKEKNKLSSLMLHLDQDGIKHHVSVVQSFCGILEKNGMDGRKMNYLIWERNLQQKNEKIRNNNFYREKFANKGDINQKEIRIIFLALILLIILSFGFVLLIILLSKQNKEVQKNVDILLNCDLNQYHSSLLLYQTYAYIGFNKISKVRMLPIAQSWTYSFNILKTSLAEFAALAQENEKEGGDVNIYNILTGNLCELLPAQGLPAQRYCPKGLNGQTQKGLLRVASSIMNTLYVAKNSFDNSNGTTEAIIEAMNAFDLTEAEPIANNYWFPAYGAISNIIRTKFEGNTGNFGKTVESVILTWIVLYLVLGPVVLWLLFRSLNKSRHDWRKMIRLVPAVMIENNKMLKSYIMTQPR